MKYIFSCCPDHGADGEGRHQAAVAAQVLPAGEGPACFCRKTDRISMPASGCACCALSTPPPLKCLQLEKVRSSLKLFEFSCQPLRHAFCAAAAATKVLSAGEGAAAISSIIIHALSVGVSCDRDTMRAFCTGDLRSILNDHHVVS